MSEQAGPDAVAPYLQGPIWATGAVALTQPFAASPSRISRIQGYDALPGALYFCEEDKALEPHKEQRGINSRKCYQQALPASRALSKASGS